MRQTENLTLSRKAKKDQRQMDPPLKGTFHVSPDEQELVPTVQPWRPWST
ncbi:MAG TPA: hypothetical protein VK673_18275 [Chthoniobacterales bacterium]|nr:hypothetical protein [Chthoniobacterales bacterium]